jgi:ATP-dependent DNA ligase
VPFCQRIVRSFNRFVYLVAYQVTPGKSGRALYEAACGWDLEGSVAKRKDSRYVSSRTRSWLKTKNPHYSQAVGRQDLFESWQGCAR